MPRPCRFFDQPQVKHSNLRATQTGVGIVNQKYCVELQYAANPGDLLDEIATGKYVIVPNHQIPVEANGKGSLDALLALTVAQHSLLRSKLSSAPAFTSSYKVSFEDLKTLNGKRQRVEAFDSQLQQLVSDHKITDSDSFLADRAQAKKDVGTKASVLAMSDSERNAKVIKSWHDPDVQMQHLNVKMNSLTSGDFPGRFFETSWVSKICSRQHISCKISRKQLTSSPWKRWACKSLYSMRKSQHPKIRSSFGVRQ